MELDVFCIKFDAVAVADIVIVDAADGGVVVVVIIVVSYRLLFKLPVLLFRLLLDGGPDGLREFTKLRPVGGFGAK